MKNNNGSVKNMTRDECEDYLRTHRTVKTKAEERKLAAVDRKLNRLTEKPWNFFS